jgi:hypothetical protein
MHAELVQEAALSATSVMVPATEASLAEPGMSEAVVPERLHIMHAALWPFTRGVEIGIEMVHAQTESATHDSGAAVCVEVTMTPTVTTPENSSFVVLMRAPGITGVPDARTKVLEEV